MACSRFPEPAFLIRRPRILPPLLDLSGLSGVYFTNATQTFTLNMNNPTANGTAILNLATNGAGTNFIAATTMNIGTGGTIAAAVGQPTCLTSGRGTLFGLITLTWELIASSWRP